MGGDTPEAWNRLRGICQAEGWLLSLDPVSDDWLNLVVLGPLPVIIGCTDAEDVNLAAAAMLKALAGFASRPEPRQGALAGRLVAGSCSSCGQSFIWGAVPDEEIELCPGCAALRLREIGEEAGKAETTLSVAHEALRELREELGPRAPKGVRPRLRRIQADIGRARQGLDDVRRR